MTEQSWTAALDDLEQQLSGHRLLLALDSDVPAAAVVWAPPSGLGPVPSDSLLRARALLQQLEEVVEQLERARAGTRRGLRLHRALPSRSPRGSSYVDVRG